MTRLALLLVLVVVASLTAAALPPVACRAADADEAPVGVSDEEIDPVDLNRAGLEDLLTLPGMDADLARAILAWRREKGPLASVEALYESPAITPSRLAEVRPWLTAEPVSRVAFELGGTLRSAGAGRPLRREMRGALHTGAIGMAARVRQGWKPDGKQAGPAEVAAAFRWRPCRRALVVLGDQAPVEGMGLLVGLSNRPAPTGVRAPVTEGGGDDRTLSRGAPAPGGRLLRGGMLTLGSRASLGLFRYQAGATAGTAGDSPARTAPVALAALTCPLPGRGAGVAPRVVHLEGRFWWGLAGWVPLAGGRVSAEAARDPAGRERHVVAAECGGPRGLKVLFSHSGGSREFVNPLGLDSERSPERADQLDTGRNENRGETALLLRARPARRVAGEIEIRGALEGATVRRGWDRPVGAGRVRLEASPGGGWSLTAELRLESRGAPGPSAAADAPIRRHGASLRAGWEREGSHLRAEWRGRLDIDVPPGGTATAALDDVQEIVSIRGKRSIGRGWWIAGGAARFHAPTATIYEERPGGLSPAVLVAGEGGRLHAALGFSLGGMTLGAFGARQAPTGGSPTWSWGAVAGLVRAAPR